MINQAKKDGRMILPLKIRVCEVLFSSEERHWEAVKIIIWNCKRYQKLYELSKYLLKMLQNIKKEPWVLHNYTLIRKQQWDQSDSMWTIQWDWIVGVYCTKPTIRSTRKITHAPARPKILPFEMLLFSDSSSILSASLHKINFSREMVWVYYTENEICTSTLFFFWKIKEKSGVPRRASLKWRWYGVLNYFAGTTL